MSLTLILADTALELIPHSLKEHASVKNNIKKYGNAGKLFDTALHHSLLEGQPKSERRGRPDILHHFLLDALGSIANMHGQLKILFHISLETPRLFQVNPTMRAPRDYIRFKSLMTQLLEIGHIPEKGEPLISKVDIQLEKWLKANFLSNEIIKMSSKGDSIALGDLFREKFDQSSKLAIIIGGFQKGDFSETVQKIPGRLISISDRPYDSWTIVQRVLTLYELNAGLLK